MNKHVRSHLAIALIAVAVLLFAGLAIQLLEDNLDSVSDSTEGGCSVAEVLEQTKLKRILASPYQIDVRRVVPPQFTGDFGYDYIRYVVPIAEVNDEINNLRNDLGGFTPAVSQWHPYRAPKWWPEPREVEVLNGNGMRVWVNKEKGTFYVYSEWGH